MSLPAAAILQHLAAVERERLARAAEPALLQRVHALKTYQQQRFAHTHADLLADPRFAAAARFFLDDLYGPQDFSERDRQFGRIVPALVRLFPHEIVATVELLARLHALSERLDSRMAGQLPAGPVQAADYAAAWQRTGETGARTEQIDLVLALGRQLDHYTRKRWLRQSLKLMRRPAHSAGLGDLQGFLERGFDTFAGMGGAEEFLRRVEHRERDLAALLFDPQAVTKAIGQLP